MENEQDGGIMANAYGTALPMNRAAARLGLAVGIAFAVAACSSGDGQVVSEPGTIGRVAKTCDQGRAIYTYKSGHAGGIAVVERAAECPASGIEARQGGDVKQAPARSDESPSDARKEGA